ncbi:MAG: GNAT family N-acetyltransferase [Acidobacteriaceae bacterium]
MPTSHSIKIGPLRQNELEEADRIVRLAFGTFIGLPNPLDFMGDRSFIMPRWGSRHVRMIAARDDDRLIGLNVVIRWGSFGFFGPLSVLPEYWDHGVAQRLLGSTMTVFDRWGLRRTGLFTFAQSAKHVGLYQKFGYWPGYLTAIMTRAPEPNAARQAPTLLSALTKAERERAIQSCAKLTGKIDKGLDLSDEIRSVLRHHVGEVVDPHAPCSRRLRHLPHRPRIGRRPETVLHQVRSSALGCRSRRALRQVARCLRGIRLLAQRGHRGWRELRPRRCFPPHESPRISSDHAGSLHAATT